MTGLRIKQKVIDNHPRKKSLQRYITHVSCLSCVHIWRILPRTKMKKSRKSEMYNFRWRNQDCYRIISTCVSKHPINRGT